MQLFVQISFLILCIFIVWRIYKVIKTNPEVMSKENLTKSFSTVGILALILIGFVTMLVVLLRNS